LPQISGVPRGYVPLVAGQFLGLPENGRQGASWNEATVGRGKAKLFPLQVASASLDGRFGKAKSSRSLHPFLCILPTLFGKEPKI